MFWNLSKERAVFLSIAESKDISKDMMNMSKSSKHWIFKAEFTSSKLIKLNYG